MTRLTYKNKEVTCVVLAAEYNRGDIREALRKADERFAPQVCDVGNVEIWQTIIKGSQETLFYLAVAYYGSEMNPARILVSISDTSGSAKEEVLGGCLDRLLEYAGIREIESSREALNREVYGLRSIVDEVILRTMCPNCTASKRNR